MALMPRSRMKASALLTSMQVYRSRKMAVLLLIGFSSGMPLYLTSRTLQAWMTVEGVDLMTIGLFGLVSLPYTWKFAWAPLVDRYLPPFLGRRRGWLVLTQVGLLLTIGSMALQDPHRALVLLAVNALLIAFLSATQDVSADAYRADVLERHELGAGAAIFVLGYRMALLATGALALILADRLSWPTVYLLMALLMIPGLAATMTAPEPVRRAAPPASLTDAVKLPFREFFQRTGAKKGVAVLGFIVLYKMGDALAGAMVTPFLLQTGFTQTDVGAVQGGIGLGATIVGVLAGGAFLSRIGISRSLWIFGGLQMASNLAYYLLAVRGYDYAFMVGAIVTEYLCVGLVAAAFVAFLMSLCHPAFSATQFAFLSSLAAFSRDVLVAPSGGLAEAVGWPSFFFISLLAAVPGLLLLPVFAPWKGLLPITIPEPGGASDATP